MLQNELRMYISKSEILCSNYMKRLENDHSAIANQKKELVKEVYLILKSNDNKYKDDITKLEACADKLSNLVANKAKFDKNRDHWLIDGLKNNTPIYYGLQLFRWIKHCFGYAGNTHGYNMVHNMFKEANVLKEKLNDTKESTPEEKRNQEDQSLNF